MSPCLQNIHGHPPFLTCLLISATNHNDTRSRRDCLRGYLGDFTALSTPALYDSRRVFIAASLRNISCSDSDICLQIVRRVSSREKRKRQRVRGLPSGSGRLSAERLTGSLAKPQPQAPPRLSFTLISRSQLSFQDEAYHRSYCFGFCRHG